MKQGGCLFEPDFGQVLEFLSIHKLYDIAFWL